MTVETFNPYLGVESAGEPIDPGPDASAAVETRFRASLVERAKKRTVRYSGNHAWNVIGDSRLGDAFEFYVVVFNSETKRYDCACYQRAHGETRAKRVCSHVLAVILWRKNEANRAMMRADDAYKATGYTVAELDAAEEADDRAPFGEALRPDDARLTPRGWEPPPEWLTEYRAIQWKAAHEIVAAFDDGAQVVFLDAPTGSGKTAIADLVARMMNKRSIYVCSSKQLQDQFLADFPYAHVLKGKANYPVLGRVDDEKAPAPFPEVSCDDCDGNPADDNCTWCQPMNACPYRRAKNAAAMGQVGVLNTAYWLREAGSQRPTFSRPDGERLFVIDECDTLEGALMGYLEFFIGQGRERQLSVTVPKKGSHKSTIVTWMRDSLTGAVDRELRKVGVRLRNGEGSKVQLRRNARRLREFALQVQNVADEIEDDNWIRDNDAGPLAMKPVRVSPYGERAVWRHGQKFLLMSATIISAEEMAESLGIEGEWRVVRVPMTFPVDQRPIHVAPVAEMIGGKTKGIESGSWAQMAYSVMKVVDRHPDERVLVHCVSYALAEFLHDAVAVRGLRHTVTYKNASERDDALAKFRTTPGAVLFAPSLDRGVDLKDEDCRVIIVAKVPYPFLGDKQINARLHAPGGQSWYSVQTIRTLVQMTGRAVRSSDDWCESYVLDKSFVSNVWKKNRALLPEWWRDALNMRFRTKDLM